MIPKTAAFFLVAMTITHHIPAQSLTKTPTNLAQNIAGVLIRQDSLLFDIAFHSCALTDLPKVLTRDFVFYHDGSYFNLTTDQDYKNFEESLKSSCQPKGGDTRMRREIQKGSLQVFIPNAREAIQTGIQRFYVQQKG